MVLQRNGESVTGTFSDLNGNPQYNGTITGTISGQMLTYTYVQPAINGAGKGGFMMKSNGTEIYGALKTDNDPNTNYRWWGKLKDDLGVR